MRAPHCHARANAADPAGPLTRRSTAVQGDILSGSFAFLVHRIVALPEAGGD
jgi:hypothetical protein